MLINRQMGSRDNGQDHANSELEPSVSTPKTGIKRVLTPSLVIKYQFLKKKSTALGGYGRRSYRGDDNWSRGNQLVARVCFGSSPLSYSRYC